MKNKTIKVKASSKTIEILNKLNADRAKRAEHLEQSLKECIEGVDYVKEYLDICTELDVFQIKPISEKGKLMFK